MTAYGVDEAWSRLTPAQLLAAGKQFVIGYVGEDASKNLTKAEVQAYLAAGVAVLLVYEYSTTAAEKGAAGGRANATLAVAQARALGYPQGCAIAFAVDEASPSLTALAAYAYAFTATCRDAGYRSMVYGGLSTVRYCLDHALVDLAWQTYAWSNGLWDSRAAIRQTRNAVTINGVDVDLDTAMITDYGAWAPGGTMADTDIPETYRTSRCADAWGNAAITGMRPAKYIGSGSTSWSSTPNVLHDKLDAILAALAAAPAPTVDQDALNAAVLAALQDSTVLTSIASAVGAMMDGDVSVSGTLRVAR